MKASGTLLKSVNYFFLALGVVYALAIGVYLVWGPMDATLFGHPVRMRRPGPPLAIFLGSAMLFALTLPSGQVFRFSRAVARKLPPSAWLIIAAGVAIRLVYVSYTDYTVRTHDVVSHLEYVDHVAQTFTLPERRQCWQCYHPPLYYIPTAAVSVLLNTFAPDRLHVGLQLWSLGLFVIFLYYGLLIIRRFVHDRFFFPMAALVLVLWPSGVMHSVRIGNDALYYPLYAAGMYYLVRWFQDDNRRDLYIAAALCALTLVTKYNGLVLAGTIGAVALYRLYKSADRMRVLRQSAIAAAIVSAGLAVGFYPAVKHKLKDANADILVGNSDQLFHKIFVGNEAKNFLYFDLASYLTHPFTDPWDDSMGRQYYWNFLLKTSLFTENRIDLKLNKITASIMSALLLLFIAYALWYAFTMNREQIHRNYFLWISALLLLAASIMFRMRIPAASSNDFRYIFPILISGDIFFVYALMTLRDKGYMALDYAGRAMVAVFLVAVVVFFINPAFASQ